MSDSPAQTWLSDKRVQSVYRIEDGERRWDVKATPDAPGGNRFMLTCRQLPGWSGRAAYAYPDHRDNVVFQFWMQTRDLRAARGSAVKSPPLRTAAGGR